MTRDEVRQALSVAIEFLVARGATTSLILASLVEAAADLGIRTVKDGTNMDEFLALCFVAFETELKKHEAVKGGS